MTGSLEIGEVHPLEPDTLGLIAESEAELASLYRPEVRSAFSPEELADAGVIFLVARRAGEPVGCGGLAPLEGYAELKRIFTTARARGTGIGSAIVAALENVARARGLTVVRLETGEASPEAIALYASLGYGRRGPFGAYRENGSSVFMEKRLA